MDCKISCPRTYLNILRESLVPMNLSARNINGVMGWILHWCATHVIKKSWKRNRIFKPLRQKSNIKIIYTGDVYLANFGCFRNLIQAMKLLEEYPLELHIFTTRLPEQLKNEGIESDKTFIHPHLPYDEILEQQRMSDILFLPLAFETPIPEIIRTSAPGKLGEYLASGRPCFSPCACGFLCGILFGKKSMWTGRKRERPCFSERSYSQVDKR